MSDARPAAPEASPRYLQRGDAVEERYQDYSRRLQAAYDGLLAILERDAPDLAEKVKEKPPRRVEYGYRLLPEIIEDKEVPERKRRATSTSYSWARTERIIDDELRSVEQLERRLEEVVAQKPGERRPSYERIVEDYPRLQENHRLADRHIQHNRLWQRAIYNDKPRFDRDTRLHDAVVERQAILDALASPDEEGFRQALEGVEGIDLLRPRSELEPELREREEALYRRIREAGDRINARGFVEVEQAGPRHWVVRVPLYTDIEDEAFVAAFERAIESYWRVEKDDDLYELRLAVTVMPPGKLYARSEGCAGGGDGECSVPERGAHINLGRHIGLFPDGGGALTTGAKAVHVKGARAIVLSPQDVAPRTLAHEFGHVLGFRDGYFRGFRDLGEDGYEVIEIVPDLSDLMHSPGAGHVQAHHFEALIAATR